MMQLQVTTKSSGLRFNYRANCEVLNVLKQQDRFLLTTNQLSDLNQYEADYVILAPGHIPSGQFSEFIGQIDNTGDVATIGSRLTAIDKVLTLIEKGHTGKIYMVSRRGLLPAVIKKTIYPYELKYLAPDTLCNLTAPLPLSTLTERFWKEISLAENQALGSNRIPNSYKDISPDVWLRTEIDGAECNQKPWQDILFSLYPNITSLWQRLGIKDLEFNINLLKKIITSLPNYVFWKDKNLIYQGCNHNFAKAAGFGSVAHIIGKRDEQLPWHPSNTQIYQAEDRHVLEKKEVILNKIVSMNLMRSGQEELKILSVSKTPLYHDDGEIAGILGIYIDITELKEAEEKLIATKKTAEAANQAKTQFLANISHEIRTPISGMVGCAQIIQEMAIDPTLKDYAANLVDSADKLLVLIDQIIESVRFFTGETPITDQIFSLKESLEEVIKLYQPTATQKGLDLYFHYDPSLSDHVISDPLRVKMIALELLGNALKFTHQGHVKLTVQLAKQTERHIIIKLCVEDTGIGILVDQHQNIFTKFTRLVASYQGVYKGMGLGLANVNQLLKDLDADIEVESLLNQGSTFSCSIPLKLPWLD